MSVNSNVAFIGVSLANKIVYNITENDGDFQYTGLSILEMLKESPNDFISSLIESQSYDSITAFEDGFFYGKFISNNNKNICTFKELQVYMNENNDFYCYVYDFEEDIIYIKTPSLIDIVALDYKNELDVREFINNNN